MNEPLSTWREEIAAELDEARAELMQLRVDAAAAVEAAAISAARYQFAASVLAAVTAGIGAATNSNEAKVAQPLAGRLAGAKQDSRTAGDLATTTARLAAQGAQRIARLEQALDQLEQAMAPEPADNVQDPHPETAAA